ncbi:hypothetical protein ColLi_04438 [Colletotrichum liriopes]|uniref:Uncharacterized protein n=1 Tax=Colletotrichum liriopes TaxID=708192 RepID=A0AA37GJ49_9PEZI|nr:hypothetical protein ColLi_04438 [Colletotrichum liriopes]
MLLLPMKMLSLDLSFVDFGYGLFRVVPDFTDTSSGGQGDLACWDSKTTFSPKAVLPEVIVRFPVR